MFQRTVQSTAVLLLGLGSSLVLLAALGCATTPDPLTEFEREMRE